MVKASAAGSLDYRQADSNSPEWLLRETLVCGMLEDDLIRQLRSAQYVADSIIGLSSGRSSGIVGDGIKESRHAFCQALFPYHKAVSARARPSMREEWEAAYGPLDSPAVQAGIKRDTVGLKQREVMLEQKRKAEQQRTAECQRKLDELHRKRLRFRYGK